MSANLSRFRHTRGFDVIKPLSIVSLVVIMLPLASIFIFGMSNGVRSFWDALIAPDALFALQLSFVTSLWATVFNIIFGLFAATFSRNTLSGGATQ